MPATIAVLGAVITALATVMLWRVTKVLAVETKRMAEASAQPQVVANIEPNQWAAMYADIVVANTGNATAFDVRVEFDPEIPKEPEMPDRPSAQPISGSCKACAVATRNQVPFALIRTGSVAMAIRSSERFVPPSPLVLQGALENWERFLQAEGEDPPFDNHCFYADR